MIIAIVLIVAFAAIAVAAVIVLKKQDEKIEELRAFLDSPEPPAACFRAPAPFEYSSEIERHINEKFAEYIILCNSFIKERGHLSYLKKRKLAEHKLRPEAEAATEREIALCDSRLKEKEAEMKNGGWHNYFSSKTETSVDLFAKFKAMSEAMPSSQKLPEPIASFSPKGKRWLPLSGGRNMLLCEFYIAVYSKEDLSIKIFDYSELSVKADYTVKSLPYGVKPKDGEQIAKKHWKYERADGTKDKRYADNPTRVDVYTAYAIVSLGEWSAKLDMPSKSGAELFERRVNAYKRALATKAIQKYVSAVFDSEVLYFKVENIEKLIQLATDKATREKEEKKLVREREAEARRLEKEEKARVRAERLANKAKVSDAPVSQSATPVFSDDEIQMILDARKEREEADKRAEEERQRMAKAARVAAVGEPPISHVGSTRVITNNLFSFTYTVNRAIDYECELFFVDALGEVVSRTLRVSLPAVGESFKATFELLSGKDFDSATDYYLFVRIVGDEEPIGKIDYKINISFVSDFDF